MSIIILQGVGLMHNVFRTEEQNYSIVAMQRLNGFMQCEITNSHYKICDKIHSSDESIKYCMLRKSAPGCLLATDRL